MAIFVPSSRTARSWPAGLAGVLAVIAFSTGSAQARWPLPLGTVLIDIKGLGPQELRTEGFVLTSAQEVQIEAVGSEARLMDRLGWTRRGEDELAKMPWSGNAWLLDVRTRQVVWELRKAATTRDDKGLRRYSGTVRLNPGVYEAHFASFTGSQITIFKDSRGQRRTTRVEEIAEAFQLTVHGVGRPAGMSELANARLEFEKNAVVVLTGLGRQASKQRGFVLARPVEIEIYCLGEAREDGSFDYGAIVNADTREQVWQLTFANSEPAGGDAKNRLVRKTLALPAGKYVASYTTDDTHDQRGWNGAPPLDPEYWGLTLRVTDPARKLAVKTFEFEVLPKRDALVSLIGVTNKESRSVGFSLTRPVELRIFALGEGTGEDMADYGWITNADTRRKVWMMEYDKTAHGGGAKKNRLIDQVVTLDKGNYLLYYVTDDSHAYNSWNSAQPSYPDLWGISVFLAKGMADRAAVQPYEPREGANVIARLARMGDMEDARKPFRLEKDTTVRIYAMGESQNNKLYDFAWIEHARTKKVVWKMDLLATTHAGGGRKNRLANVTITLPAGEYVLRYESDDSHSFGNWNQAAPDDPEGWGVTVFRAGETP